MPLYPPPIDPWITSDLLDAGEGTIARKVLGSGTQTLTSGVLRLTYFTARKTETVNTIRTISGGTASGTPTLARVGLYSVAANGDLTLVASCANDTSMWAIQNTRYPAALSAPYVKQAGQRYALGALFVGDTAPNINGAAVGASANESADSPRLASFIGSQTDLPASIAVGSLSNSTALIYAVILP